MALPPFSSAICILLLESGDGRSCTKTELPASIFSVHTFAPAAYTPVDVVDALDWNPDLRAAVASNLRATRKAIASLAKDSEKEGRLAVARELDRGRPCGRLFTHLPTALV
jgi:hypothetical protein